MGAEEAADIVGRGEAAEAAAREELMTVEGVAAEEEDEEEDDEWSSDGTTYEDGVTPRGVAYGDGAGLSEEGEEEDGEEAEEEAAEEEAAKEAVVVAEESEGAAGVHAGHHAGHSTPRACMYPEEEAGVSHHASRQGWSGPASSVASDLEAAEEEEEAEEEAEAAEAEAAVAAPSLAVAFLRAQESEGRMGRDKEGGGGGEGGGGAGSQGITDERRQGGEDDRLFEAQWLAACARAAGEGPEDPAGAATTAEARTVPARRHAAHCNPILSAPACNPVSAALQPHSGVGPAAAALQGCRQQSGRQAAPRQHSATRRRPASPGGRPGSRGQA